MRDVMKELVILFVVLLLVVLVATACSSRERAEACNIPSDRQQATATNDRARRAQYPNLSNREFDSVAVVNCWTVVR